jgi:hypothetical protein
MVQTNSIKIGVERCLNCGHKWIDYSQSREFCYMCGRKGNSETLSLNDIKNAIGALRHEDKQYLDKHTKRASVLKQRYRETTDLYLNRAKEIFSKVKQIYSHGEMSERLIDQLIFCFRLYSEVGLNKSAASCAYMTATAYTQRGIEREVQSVDDLGDLIAARQWFMRLDAKDWEMAVNLHVGEKAMATISTEPMLLQTMMQIALWHFYQARNYYFEKKAHQLVERIQFDIDQTTKLLSSYTRGLSEIEAAKITAAASESQGKEIRKGLEVLGSNVGYGLESLGEQIERFGGSLNRAIQGSVGIISASVSHSAYALSAAVGRPSKILKDSVIDIGRMISASVQAVPADAVKSVNSLGTKLARSTANKGLMRKVVSDSAFQNLTNSVLPSTDTALTTLSDLEQPSEHAPDSLMDALVAEGMDSVLHQIERRRLHPN